ncbi:MAG: phosphoglucosamine mutase [Acidobacteria bacterium]|nr:MAG: phosphoglucosamine mutase [Acidobacteriota bacterium]
MNLLKISISGVRGIVGATFTPELVVNFAQAFGTYLESGKILICRDTRPSGAMVRSAVISGLISTGCEVVDLGICPTPSMQLLLTNLNARGGIAISGGHNPEEWNALKFVREDGIYLNALQASELLDVYHQGEFNKVPWNRLFKLRERNDAIEHHLSKLRQNFEWEAIRKRRFRVAVDCCNGACSEMTPRFLEELGCNVVSINDSVQERFPHDPNPTPSNMQQLRALVKASRADIGFAHDADGERLGIVTEQGTPLSEEWTLAIVTEIELSKQPGVVVTNLSTTQAIDEIALRHGGGVIRTPIGQAYVAEMVKEVGAVLGGEGSGGVILPKTQFTHDSFAAIGSILEFLALHQNKVSELVDRIPGFFMIKRNLASSPSAIYASIQELRSSIEFDAKGSTVDLSDGIKLSWPDGWVHIRDSNTESMIRVIAEAREAARAEALADWAQSTLRLEDAHLNDQ